MSPPDAGAAAAIGSGETVRGGLLEASGEGQGVGTRDGVLGVFPPFDVEERDGRRIGE